MDEILTNLTTPAWWWTAIFAATLASILASYLKPIFDMTWSKLSDRYKIQMTKSEQASSAQLLKLRSNINNQILAGLEVNFLRLRALTFLFFSVGFLSMQVVFITYNLPMLAQILVGLLGVASYFSGAKDIFDSNAIHKVLERAKKDE